MDLVLYRHEVGFPPLEVSNGYVDKSGYPLNNWARKKRRRVLP